jgi:hypothetical protein
MLGLFVGGALLWAHGADLERVKPTLGWAMIAFGAFANALSFAFIIARGAHR